jgi:hypothetical protein
MPLELDPSLWTLLDCAFKRYFRDCMLQMLCLKKSVNFILVVYYVPLVQGVLMTDKRRGRGVGNIMGIPPPPPSLIPTSLNNPNPSLSRRVSFPEAGGEPDSGKREILRITCSDGLQKGWR